MMHIANHTFNPQATHAARVCYPMLLIGGCSCLAVPLFASMCFTHTVLFEFKQMYASESLTQWRSYTRAYQGTGPGRICLCPGKTSQ